MELRWSICTQNVPPNGLLDVSTVNNGVTMYPKFVKTNRGVQSVAMSTQQTVIKNMYARKNMNMQKIVSHHMKFTVWIAARITQHLIKTAKCTMKWWNGEKVVSTRDETISLSYD